jgi:hypothetical protein
MEIKVYTEQVVQGSLVDVRAGPYDPNEYDYLWEFPDFDPTIATQGDSDAERRIDTKGLQRRPFKVFFSAATGFGTISLTRNSMKISMVEGELQVDKVSITVNGINMQLEPKTVARVGQTLSLKLSE